jgi:hypothetical protein
MPAQPCKRARVSYRMRLYLNIEPTKASAGMSNDTKRLEDGFTRSAEPTLSINEGR